VDPFITVQFIQKNPTRCKSLSKFIIPYLYEAQHVSGDTPPIIRSLKLHQQPLVLYTWKVVGRVVAGRCQRPAITRPVAASKQLQDLYDTQLMLYVQFDSWWWTERPSETCTMLFQNKINLRYCASGWFYYRNILRYTVLHTSNLHWLNCILESTGVVWVKKTLKCLYFVCKNKQNYGISVFLQHEESYVHGTFNWRTVWIRTLNQRTADQVASLFICALIVRTVWYAPGYLQISYPVYT
jgi:hypothetical protein